MRLFLFRLVYNPLTIYLPPLEREAFRDRNWPMRFSLLALLGAALIPPFTLWGFGLAIGVTILFPLVHFRTLPIHDLLDWTSRLDYGVTEAERDANFEATQEACTAIGEHRPRVARDALARVVEPDPWRATVALYYGDLVDLLDSRQPDVQSLADQVAALAPGPRATVGRVFVALVEAGAANLSGGDWRAPLLACKKELGVPRSFRRALWQMVLVYFIVAAMMLVAGAIVILRG